MRARQMVVMLCVCGVAAQAAESAEAPKEPNANRRQLLVVAPGYWRAGDAAKFSFEVYDLDAGFKRVHRADPGKVGEIRGVCASPATQRLYVSGHEGLLCYDWPKRKLLWRVPVEGEKKNQNDAITVTADGARLYTIRHFGRGLNVYDAADGKRLRVIHEEEKAAWGRFSQVSHDGARLYAGKCDGGGGEVFIIDTADDKMIGRFKPVIEPIRFALTPDGKRFVYATGMKRSLAVNAAADGKLLHEIPVPAWEGAVAEKASVQWMALSPDGAQAWACDPKNPALHRFDLSTDPPRYAGRVEAEPGTEGLMFSADGRFLVTGKGAVLAPTDGKPLGRLQDEQGKPCPGSNSMMALEVDAKTERLARTNQQCAPAWPGTPPAGARAASRAPVTGRAEPPSPAAGARPDARPPAVSGAGQPDGAVLIATEQSDFKKALADLLTASIAKAGLRAEVIALKDLLAVDPAPYRAVVVVTLAPEWEKTKTVPKFLDGKDDAVRAKTVVVTTAKTADWKPKQKGIDAITRPSTKDGVGELAETILGKLGIKP